MGHVLGEGVLGKTWLSCTRPRKRCLGTIVIILEQLGNLGSLLRALVLQLQRRDVVSNGKWCGGVECGVTFPESVGKVDSGGQWQVVHCAEYQERNYHS